MGYSRLSESRPKPQRREDERISSPSDGTTHSEFGSVVAEVGSRVQEVLDTAERMAGEIRSDAEAAAANYLRERNRDADRAVQERIAELDAITQSLAVRAASMERETTAFVAEVEQIRWRMARLLGDEGWRAELAASENRAPQSPEATGASEAAALRATQMAVAGANRPEIERMLREQFGLEDPAAIDAILRPESP